MFKKNMAGKGHRKREFHPKHIIGLWTEFSYLQAAILRLYIQQLVKEAAVGGYGF